MSSHLDSIHSLLSQARHARQRRMVWLAGERVWAVELAQQALMAEQFQVSVAISDQPLLAVETLPAVKAKQLLGRELDCLVYDAWAGLNPDALAGASGALRGGGVLFLITPPVSQWPRFADPDYQRMLVHGYSADAISGRFLTRLCKVFAEDSSVLTIAQDQPPRPNSLIVHPEFAGNASNHLSKLGDGCLTVDQSQALTTMLQMATSHHNRRPLVIRADRGRGKSSAMGIAAARLLAEAGVKRIVLTAPRIESVTAVFDRAAEYLQAPVSKHQIAFGEGGLFFVAPDALLREKPAADVLLVDEAAAIPAAMLQRMLSHYRRVVFATTIHGYEGTGRGFDIRFRETLDTVTPQWQLLELKQAIRWAEGDPVEACLSRALLLDAQAVPDVELQGFVQQELTHTLIDRDQLLAPVGEHTGDELSQLFGLLVQAHYQTTPADLRGLLDGPNISVWLSRWRGRVVAAALVAKEGAFDKGLAAAIWRGERRPRGHLLPQNLCAQAGWQQAAELRYWRVMRIAVHPALQRRGVGQQLIAAIVKQARSEQVDILGSSFAATDDVLAFWQAAQCWPVRLGVSRDTSTGCHSAIVLSGLSQAGNELVASVRQRFEQELPYLLMGVFRELEPELVAALLQGFNTVAADQQDWLDLRAFCEGRRQYQHCMPALSRLALNALANAGSAKQLDGGQKSLMINLLLQQQPAERVISSLGLSGKKSLHRVLKELFSTL